MNEYNKRLIKKGTLILVSIVVGIYLLITLVMQAKFQSVKHEVLENNPEITSVESVNKRGEWGAFIIEYVLVVKKGTDETYRIWANEDGKITDEVSISN